MNFTGVRMIDPEDDYVKQMFDRYLSNVEGLSGPTNMPIETALMFDSMQLFARAFKQLKDAVKGDVKALPCNGSLSWEHGLSLTNFIRLVSQKIIIITKAHAFNCILFVHASCSS